MTHPIPPGTRDILPDEMRELRGSRSALVETFERFGYGEVATPTIEYEEVLARGDERGAPVAYRFFDETGELLALRSDMTIPIARLVANRFATAEPPFRLCYLGPRLPRGPPPARPDARVHPGRRRADRRDAPDGTAEVIEVLSAALDAAGLTRAVIGLGDARPLPPAARRARGRRRRRDAILDSTRRSRPRRPRGRGWARWSSIRVRRETLLALPTLRGGPRGARAGARARRRGGRAGDGAPGRDLRGRSSTRGVAERVSLDLGLLRDLGYYTGAIFEVYDPALGHVLGGGGRYDELMGRFGRPLPAAGFALYLERVHVAQAEEERLSGRSS